jgi:transposase
LGRAKKKAAKEDRTIVFVDEAGFYLLPLAVRTYAPMGQTPILPVKLTHDHLSAIGAITSKGKICMQTQDHAYKGLDVVRFLQLLLREIPGNLLIIWDGASIHRSQPIKDFLTQGGAKRIHLERLPSYAPELNPQEGVWNLLGACRTQECLLSRRPTRVASCQRTAEASQIRSSPVFRPCWLFSLVLYAEVNNACDNAVESIGRETPFLVGFCRILLSYQFSESFIFLFLSKIGY